MKLWTIQPFSVWEQIRDRGEAHVDPQRNSTPDYIPSAYDWLRRQLYERLEGYRGGHLWWCYRAKPDLRTHRHGHLSGGQRQVRLELELSPSRVQIFRIWAWHQVYCGLYLGTRRQERDWRRRRYQSGVCTNLHDCELGEPWRTELEQSWERVFAALPPRKNLTGPSSYEAVVEVLRLEDVRKVDRFKTTYESFEAQMNAAIPRRGLSGCE